MTIHMFSVAKIQVSNRKVTSNKKDRHFSLDDTEPSIRGNKNRTVKHLRAETILKTRHTHTHIRDMYSKTTLIQETHVNSTYRTGQSTGQVCSLLGGLCYKRIVKNTQLKSGQKLEREMISHNTSGI